ncbi:TPA: HNH endonuclease signature motif containing protein [Stenotrophomonas maltophilia]
MEVWNGRRRVLAHRVVWEAAVGPIPLGLQVNHKNGVKTDNRLCNLELVTPSENLRHAHRIGLKHSEVGVDRYNAKLDDEAVRDIRRSVEKQLILARRYGVHPSIISEVRARKRWAHVKD